MRRIRIRAGDIEAYAELYNTPTADALWQALPLQLSANRWGEEIYGRIPVAHELAEDAREVVEAGELGYWPPGGAFCIFFGPTPASHGDEIRAASPVNILGRVCGDPMVFKRVSDGTVVQLEQAEQ